MGEIIKVERQILKKNDEIAAENRKIFAEKGLFVFNLLSSPGSGKTSLLEQTLKRLNGRLRVAVLEGDVQTDLDAQRISRFDVPVIQIVTKGGCHLEASLIQSALSNFNLNELDLLIIENVGNLVCPSNYDLGEATKVVVVSTTEGDDKPLKYPKMFRVSDVMVVNKIDLLPYVDFDVEKVIANARSINPNLKVFQTSCRTGEGLEDWVEWIETAVAAPQK
ncbi:MAG: hydrogenase nickel incorporation protein HypB [Calditrichia bacterium]